MKIAYTLLQSIVWVLMMPSLITLDAVQADDDFQFVSMWGNKGDGPGEFDGPFDVAVDREGFVYVTDTGNRRIQKFSPDETLILQWGSQGTGPGTITSF